MRQAVIKVFGVGGGGSNAVNNMLQHDIQGEEEGKVLHALSFPNPNQHELSSSSHLLVQVLSSGLPTQMPR